MEVKKLYYKLGIVDDYFKLEAKRFMIAFRYLKKEPVNFEVIDGKDLFSFSLSFGFIFNVKVFR